MIQPTSNFHGYSRTDSLSGSGAKPAPAPKSSVSPDEIGGERLQSSNTDALKDALNATPEVRPEVVAKGKALAVDSNYPPREIIAKLAELLVQTRDLSAE